MSLKSEKAGDVHLFQYRGVQLAYDVNSGSLHEVDDLGREALELLLAGYEKENAAALLKERYTSAAVEEILKEIEELREKKLLFAPEPPLVQYKPSSRGVKALCLFISHSCNLGCRYCFNSRVAREQRQTAMTWEVGKKAVDFLLQSNEGRFREIDFFGGEPLLNFGLVKEIIAYAREQASSREKEFTFTLTTNATLLDESSMEYLNKEGINVILSLDGRPFVHDGMRPFPNGEGSYQKTVENIRKFLQGRADNYYIRGTYTRNNLDFTADIRHFLELGFFYLSLEPVISRDETLALREEDLPLLEREYDRLIDLYLEYRAMKKPFTFYHFLLDLAEGPCLYKRLGGCGAGTDYLAVAADGSLYPCHQFMGVEDFYLGNITTAGQPEFNREAGEKFAAAAWHKEACRDCWARYLCGRGCAASSYFLAGDLNKTYDLGCALEKIRLERALYLQAVGRGLPD